MFCSIQAWGILRDEHLEAFLCSCLLSLIVPGQSPDFLKGDAAKNPKPVSSCYLSAIMASSLPMPYRSSAAWDFPYF